MEAYFWKLELISTILTSLDAPVNDEDLVHYAIEGLSDRYDQVCGIMHHKDTFPDFKTARSMLITEEMRLKSKSLALPLDSSSSSHMVLMAQNDCKFVHDHNAKSGVSSGSKLKNNNNDDLLVKLLAKLGMSDLANNNGSTKSVSTPSQPSLNISSTNPVAYHASGLNGYYVPPPY
ncbi:hypothetical protein Tco_0584019 [Tanacetum coccineum]